MGAGTHRTTQLSNGSAMGLKCVGDYGLDAVLERR
jgi:hypothetical protein